MDRQGLLGELVDDVEHPEDPAIVDTVLDEIRPPLSQTPCCSLQRTIHGGCSGRIVLREPVRAATWIAIVIAISGVSIMVADETGDVALSGSLAALGSAVGFAVFTVALRWGRTGEMLPAVFLSGLFGIVITFRICQLLQLPLALSVHNGGIAMCMGVFQINAGLILYTLGSRSLPAAELALLSLAEVLLAICKPGSSSARQQISTL